MREDQLEQLRTENQNLRETLAILERSASHYADAYDFAPVGLCLVDADAMVSEVNLTGATLLGRRREDLLGRPLAIVLGVQPGDLRPHFERCRASGRKTTTRFSQGAADDDRALELTSVAVGESFATEFRDVSERKREIHALNFLGTASHRLLGLVSPEEVAKAAVGLALAFSSFAALDILGADGRWVPGARACVDERWTERLAEIGLGFTLLPRVREAALMAESSGQTQLIADLGRELDHPRLLPGRAELVGGLQLGPCIVIPLVSEQKTIAMLTLVQRLADRSFGPNEVALAVELGRRIAAAMERSLLHREVVRASLAKDRFLAMVSHELRTPIAALFMWIRALRDSDDDVTRANAIGAIEEAAKLQSRLVGDLIDLASSLAGKMSLSLAPVDLERTLLFAVETQRNLAAQSRLSIHVVTHRRCGEVWADATRVVQIVTNLLSNAIKFSFEGGRIVVSLDADADDAVMTVKDEGRGISSELMSRLFDPFQQGDDVPRHKTAGLGLGLAIVKQLAELHGGSVSATSQGRNQGAELTVRLPLLQRAEASSPSFLAAIRTTPPVSPGSPASPESDDEPAARGEANELRR